jgi:hypothetical protein
MAQRPPVRLTPAQIAAMARARGLDPQAVLSVANAEGLSGRIGDNGHAFGPFQLNNAGGVITGRFPGQTPEQINQWAWSPQGVAYALGGIGNVARGLKGRQAVDAIVRRFERPADPSGEVARALSAYGTSATANPVFGSRNAGVPASPLNPSTPRASVGSVVPGRNPLLAIIQTTRRALGIQGSRQDPLAQLLAGRSAASDRPDSFLPPDSPGRADPAPALRPVASNGGPRPFQVGNIAELLHEGVGGPTHSTGEHIHVASTSPQVMLALIAEAQRRGLSARENPYVDPVDPVHAPHSFHKRTFPGRYHGRRLGEAVDVSGPGMGGYEAWVRRTYRRRT